MTPLGTAPGGMEMVTPAAEASNTPPDDSNVLVRAVLSRFTLGNVTADTTQMGYQILICNSDLLKELCTVESLHSCTLKWQLHPW